MVQVDQEIPAVKREMQSTEPVEATQQVILGEGRSLNISTQLPGAKKIALQEFLKKRQGCPGKLRNIGYM
jgi:hypothetical protein